jgi:hypothetical protein
MSLCQLENIQLKLENQLFNVDVAPKFEFEIASVWEIGLFMRFKYFEDSIWG